MKAPENIVFFFLFAGVGVVLIGYKIFDFSFTIYVGELVLSILLSCYGAIVDDFKGKIIKSDFNVPPP